MKCFFLLLAVSTIAPEDTTPLRFERIVIDDRFPGGYQVEIADVDGDGKPDIIALGGSTCVWYQNSTWKKRIISTAKQTPGIISSATRDLDGDGKAEVAIAYEFTMTKPNEGKVLLARQGKSVDDAWSFEPIADLGSVHRLRWANLMDDQPQLVAAPIFGSNATPPAYDQQGAQIRLFHPKLDGTRISFVTTTIAHEFPVLHAIEISKIGKTSEHMILTASNQGIGKTVADSKTWVTSQVSSGAKGENPKRGSSEIHLGQIKGKGDFYATIEPWHGNQVVVTKATESGPAEREILDDTLDDGHALWVVDIDGDGTDEIFAGHRGKDARVSVYRYDGKAWLHTILDPDVAAQDLRGGDLDGDRVPDVIAVGGKTQNIVWYRPILREHSKLSP